MKAFALTTADQPASLVDLPDPETGAGALRVRVRAASINAFDVHHATGLFMGMIPHDLPTVVGRDFAGVVEAVGEGRTDVAVGDEIFGFVSWAPPLHDGSFTETVVSGDLIFAPKPPGLSFERAASLGLAGIAALDLVEAVDPALGDVVVVAGATGGVGSIAVQLAAKRGASVVATAKAGEQEAFVRSLGASDTVDYAAGNVAEQIRARYPAGVDALIDTVNRDEAAAELVATVRDGGRLATTQGTADVEGLATRTVRATNVVASPTPEKLGSLAAQAVGGGLIVQIQETFPLAEVQAALAAFSAGTTGKIVVVG
ncbi:MAG TPA: NADP-dependent oxidoreductase [Candidatus Limnocylindrales bacterium]|jgi:NADPH:quinone reductase-like Zn-dependent oxidoreductase